MATRSVMAMSRQRRSPTIRSPALLPSALPSHAPGTVLGVVVGAGGTTTASSVLPPRRTSTTSPLDVCDVWSRAVVAVRHQGSCQLPCPRSVLGNRARSLDDGFGMCSTYTDRIRRFRYSSPLAVYGVGVGGKTLRRLTPPCTVHCTTSGRRPSWPCWFGVGAQARCLSRPEREPRPRWVYCV